MSLVRRENPNVDMKRCSNSCTSSASATISDSKWDSDKMVKNELDAARALADFAELALLERENPNVSRKWGHKRRRSKKRVKKEETSIEDLGKNLEWSKFKSCSDLVQLDRSVEIQPWDKKHPSTTFKTVKAEQDSDLSTTDHTAPRTCAPLNGGRSKQSLSEAEKEARRLRRVLANRESARQTIRRRQAMCEELTKKAADLALDNESMKQKKEEIMKEYQSLKDTNKQLKSQMAKTKPRTEETPLTMPKAHVSSGDFPQPECQSPPVTPFIWSSVKEPLQKQQIALSSTNGPKPPFYIFPGPWFFPLPDYANQLLRHPHDPSDLGDRKYDNFDGKLHDTVLSLKPMGNIEIHQSSSCRDVKIDPSCSTETSCADNFPESSIRLLSNVGGNSEERLAVLSFLRSVKPENTVKTDMELHQDSNSRKDTVSTAGSHVSGSLPQTTVNTYANKTSVDVAAAAEARRRRKEVTKLKSHRNRQLRFQC